MHLSLRPQTLALLLSLSLPAALPMLQAQETSQTTPAEAPQEAAAEAEAPKSFPERLKDAGVELVQGPLIAKLGQVAEVKVPEGAWFIAPGEKGIQRYMDLTQNSSNGREVGILISPNHWTLYFEYNDTGHVKDDEKDKLDAAEMMETMTANQDSANKAREQRGWSTMKMRGWATEPHYDEKTNNLKWAFKLSSSDDNHEGLWINESIRLLGRTGVMEVTLVSDLDIFKESEKESTELLQAGFNFVDGHKYSEFRDGDKLAQYGLAALVVGGGAAIAAKTGLLAKLWKPIALGIAALFAMVGKFFKRLSGKNPE